MIIYFISYLMAILITSISQIFLKIGANEKNNENVFKSFFNIWTITGYFFVLFSTLLSLFALQKLELKTTVFLLPLGIIFVGLFSFFILKEKLSKYKIVGSIVIIIGIIIFNIK